jgi:hypothetical protein
MAFNIQYTLEKMFNQAMRLIPSASGKILTNKWILYLIFVIGIYDIIHFYQRGDITSVAIFFIVGLLTSFFSKNMIVIIVVAIAVSHLVAYGNKMTEGLENEEEDKEEEDVEGLENEEEEEDVEEGLENEEDAEEEVEEAKDSFTDKKDTKKKVELMKSGETYDLSAQTSDLLKKQKELMKNMNQLEPLLSKAENMFGSIAGGSKKHEGFGGISNFAEYR